MSKKAHEMALPKLRFPEFQDAEAWEEKELGEICEVLNNRRKPITGSDRTKGQYPYYGASGIVDYVKNFIFNERLLLVGEDGAKWGAFENTAFIVAGEYWVNNHAHVLRPVGINDTLLEKYLVMLDLAPFVTGAAPPKLTLGKLKRIPIPIPPTQAEQRKIAATLSSLDALLTAQTAKLTALQAHKRGLVQDLFPAEGETVPKRRFPEFQDTEEWGKTSLEKECHFQDGFSFKSTDFVSESQNAIQVVRITDINNKNQNSDKVYVHNSFLDNSSLLRYLIEKGDLLLSLTGAAGFNFFIWDGDVAFINQRTTKISIKEKGSNALTWLLEAFVSDKINSHGEGQNNNLSRGFLNSVEFMIPSTLEQQKIASVLSSLDNLITAQTQKIDTLKLHKKGLMQALFPVASEQDDL